MRYAAFRRLRSLCMRSLNAALTLTARCRQPTGEGNDDDDYRNKLSSQGRRDDMPPPPMAVRLAADLRPSADGSAVRTSVVTGQLQAASVPIA